MINQLMSALHEPVYQARTKGLVAEITKHLRPNDRVLDIGCGTGNLGRAIMDAAEPGMNLDVRGIERFKRGGEAIPVEAYDGKQLPYEDNAFDVTILADVLHHEERPDNLTLEAKRVAKRVVIIKDHKVDGPLAHGRISLMDWAANNPYGVKCLYEYRTLTGWRETHQRLGLPLESEQVRMTLYPVPYRWFFTSRLQYFAVLRANKMAAGASTSGAA